MFPPRWLTGYKQPTPTVLFEIRFTVNEIVCELTCNHVSQNKILNGLGHLKEKPMSDGIQLSPEGEVNSGGRRGASWYISGTMNRSRPRGG